MKRPLIIGCTLARHREIGIHAVVNARGGMQALNAPTPQEIEQQRDARKVREWFAGRVTIHQLNSRVCRRRLAHLVQPYEP